MDRQSALVLIILLWIVLFMLAYYGCMLSRWASIVFSTFVALILLLLFYPPSQVAVDSADFTLILYGVLILIGFIIIGFYVVYGTLTDVRCL